MEFAESVDAVEAATKLDFLAALPDDVENQIESVVPEELW
jgi:DNA/RNA endonuclease G (NUC1)